jgi:hypothetical protein
VDGSISHVVAHNTPANTILHNEIHGKVLDEEDTVVSQCSAEQSVEHAMSSSISNSAASVGLTSLSEVLRLSTKGSLINLAFIGSRERHAVALQLINGFGSFSSHVLNSVLITKPISTFNGVVEVPLPVIFMHVSKSSVNSTLSSDSVRPGWE